MEHNRIIEVHEKPGPKKITRNLLITLIIGAVYFYFVLPPLNPKAPEFYSFLLLLLVVYSALTLLTVGKHAALAQDPKQAGILLRRCCKVPLILAGVILAVCIIGWLTGLVVFRAGAYSSLLKLETGDFATEVEQISFDQIPMLDDASAERLGDRKLGELSDMVSQFEVANDYAQINYQNRPVRVTYLQYGDFFKWWNNRDEGIPAYITIDMVTQEADVVRLDEGIRYSPSELFGRKLQRHLRFSYPTLMFSNIDFEIDDTGHPYWICSVLDKTIGLFGGRDVVGAVLLDAVTGESIYYDVADVPSWVDRVYPDELIIEQYDYRGQYQNGFLNSIFGQKDVTVTTAGWNYIAMDDDVWLYTGITSVTGDESNIGFILVNQRTKEARYYACAGAQEYSAMNSAQGEVQHLNYKATFPLLLNISGQPTYFMALKDAAQLVKMYAMVNVAQYQIVATGTTVAECEQAYYELLVRHGILSSEEADTPMTPYQEVTGKIAEIRSAVLEGTTYYYFRLDGETVFYRISAAVSQTAVILSEGDQVTISYTDSDGAILEAASIEPN